MRCLNSISFVRANGLSQNSSLGSFGDRYMGESLVWVDNLKYHWIDLNFMAKFELNIESDIYMVYVY